MNSLFIKEISICWEQIGQDSYLRRIPSLRGLEQMEFHAPVVCFVGENGTGKSTLLEAVAVAWGFNPEGGSRNYRFSTYDSHSELGQAMTLVKGPRKNRWGYFLRAESFYNVATKEMDYVDENHPSMRLHERSHGESFLAVIQEKLSKEGLYILDEPEAALSPQRQLTLLLEMKRSVDEGAQYVIATHSPILLGFPDAEIFSFDEGRIQRVEYEETESYQVTKLFLEHREELLRRLFD